MFDTMTLTKIVGAFCGALLIFLLGGWAGEVLYHTGGGHGDHAQQAYVIETGEEDAGAEEETVEIPFAEYFAAADAAKGEKVYNKCKACHSLEDGKNGTGPTLFGVVDRGVDAVAGYGYSGALEKVADVWSTENLNDFLIDPKGYAPGTKMGFKGLPKPEDRANLIAFLQANG